LVSYWAAEPPRSADLSAYQPNKEIDDVRWVRLSKARKRLTYAYDVDLLDVFAKSAYESRPLLILRHAHARSRKTWRTDDNDRPLNAEGTRQAARLVRLMAAYGVTRVVSSDAARCVDTVLPYVNSRRKVRFRLDPALSEEGADPAQIRRRVGALLADDRRAAVCSHRPVLPHIFDSLGLESMSLEPGGFVVVHRHGSRVVGTEVHPS
jgi:8-oxo-dGTP diphosphatase